MKKIRLLILIDIMALVGLVLSFGSGLLVEEFFESPGVKFIGFGRGDWMEIHVFTSWIFVILVAIHLLLHFGWIKNIGRLWKAN
jgi:cytochrome b561